MSDTCHICNSSKLAYNHKYFSFPIIKCNQCGFIRATKTPSEVKLIEYYSIYSYDKDSGVDQITLTRYQEILKKIKPYQKTNKLLDFGCGLGHFLEAAKEENWDVYGYELSQKANELLIDKNIKTICEEEFTQYNNQFDVIICIEVIEHVTHPLETIFQIQKLLRSGGILYLTTPNIKNFSLSYMKNKEFFITYPEHLNYFTVKSIRKILDPYFNILHLKTTGIIPYRRSVSTNEVAINIQDLDHCKVKLESRFGFKLLKSIINALLNLVKRGDTIKVFAIKH